MAQARIEGTQGRRPGMTLEQAQEELVAVGRAIEGQRRRLRELARQLRRCAPRGEVVDQAGGEVFTVEGWLAEYLADIASGEVATAARIVARARVAGVPGEIRRHCRAERRRKRREDGYRQEALRLVAEIARARAHQTSPMGAQARFRELTHAVQPDGRLPFAQRRETLTRDAERLGLTLVQYLDARGEIMVDDTGRLSEH